MLLYFFNFDWSVAFLAEISFHLFEVVRSICITYLFVDSSLHALLDQVHRYVVLTIIDAVKQNLTVTVQVSILQDSFYQFLYSRQIVFLKSIKLVKKSFEKKMQIIISDSLDAISPNCRILETKYIWNLQDNFKGA